MQETNVFITNLDKTSITNKNNGVVTDYCIITYFIQKEEDDRHRGPAQLQCYVLPSAFDSLKDFMFKWHKASINQIVEKNRLKLKIKSVENVVVS